MSSKTPFQNSQFSGETVKPLVLLFFFCKEIVECSYLRYLLSGIFPESAFKYFGRSLSFRCSSFTTWMKFFANATSPHPKSSILMISVPRESKLFCLKRHSKKYFFNHLLKNHPNFCKVETILVRPRLKSHSKLTTIPIPVWGIVFELNILLIDYSISLCYSVVNCVLLICIFV